jgi:hypothetical protein
VPRVCDEPFEHLYDHLSLPSFALCHHSSDHNLSLTQSLMHSFVSKVFHLTRDSPVSFFSPLTTSFDSLRLHPEPLFIL